MLKGRLDAQRAGRCIQEQSNGEKTTMGAPGPGWHPCPLQPNGHLCALSCGLAMQDLCFLRSFSHSSRSTAMKPLWEFDEVSLLDFGSTGTQTGGEAAVSVAQGQTSQGRVTAFCLDAMLTCS